MIMKVTIRREKKVLILIPMKNRVIRRGREHVVLVLTMKKRVIKREIRVVLTLMIILVRKSTKERFSSSFINFCLILFI